MSNFAETVRYPFFVTTILVMPFLAIVLLFLTGFLVGSAFFLGGVVGFGAATIGVFGCELVKYLHDVVAEGQYGYDA